MGRIVYRPLLPLIQATGFFMTRKGDVLSARGIVPVPGELLLKREPRVGTGRCNVFAMGRVYTRDGRKEPAASTE